MSWTERECEECGTYVSIGIYYSEHEHRDTEYNITVKCGYCVNGTTEEEEQQKEIEEMNIQKFLRDGLVNTVDITDFKDSVKEILYNLRKMYNTRSGQEKEHYGKAFYHLWKHWN